MIKITHVIFDVDGLILDTESIYTEFTSNFLSGYNLQFDYNIKKLMMGRKPHEAGEILVKHYNLPLSANEFIQRQSEYITPERWESVQCLPGAEKLILHLASHNIPMALATGCCSYELDQKMRNHQVIMTKVSHSVCSGDDPTVKHGKPMPDIFLTTANRFKIPPDSSDNVLVFEDSPNGVEAALSAGMHVVWIPDPREPPGNFPKSTSSTDISRVTRLNCLSDFKPEQFGLPRFENDS
ncbi:unnamed protein product [Schistosoma margrebowiei]|uniref:pseudouridine 5'-phosphatase n=2 Tax=Schistosoma TaxID=6181 RepID=A0A183L9V9_9TREM|nr:unnamed protein product [Schistosoma margrebowiei]VDO48665.1 unnamed protein product [Schistosoma margrebowiei]